jgi:type IV secretory pathway VirB2 component (pilin)
MDLSSTRAHDHAMTPATPLHSAANWPNGPTMDTMTRPPAPPVPPRSTDGRSARWIASLCVLAAGWTALAVGVVTSAVVRDHTDGCGQPANLPSASGGPWGFLAAVLALAAVGTAIASGRRAGWHRAVPVIVGGAGLVGAALVLIGWIVLTHFQICF